MWNPRKLSLVSSPYPGEMLSRTTPPGRGSDRYPHPVVQINKNHYLTQNLARVLPGTTEKAGVSGSLVFTPWGNLPSQAADGVTKPELRLAGPLVTPAVVQVFQVLLRHRTRTCRPVSSLVFRGDAQIFSINKADLYRTVIFYHVIHVPRVNSKNSSRRFSETVSITPVSVLTKSPSFS